MDKMDSCSESTYDDRMHRLVLFNGLLPGSSGCHVFVGRISWELELIQMPVHHYIEEERLFQLFVPSSILLRRGW